MLLLIFYLNVTILLGGSTSESTQSKRGRGPATGISTWGTGERFHLTFDEHMQPNGPNANKFKTQLGIIAKNGYHVPLTYTKWIDMPEDVLNYIWKDVQVSII